MRVGRGRAAILGGIAGAGALAAWLGCGGSSEPIVTTLHDRLFVISSTNDGNTAVFIHADGVILVDTKDRRTGPRLLAVLKSITGRPVTHIINTHTHADHVGGNALFAATVEVVAHENTMGQMARMEEFRDASTRHGLPDRSFKDRLTVLSGPDSVDLYYFGPAHTNGDAFIVFRDLGIMHSGDTFPGVNVVAANGGSREQYPETMRRAAGITGVHTVIPGHGDVATWAAFVADVDNMRRR